MLRLPLPHQEISHAGPLFPAANAASHASALTGSSAAAPSPSRAVPRTSAVVVDDDPRVRSIVATMLANAGYEVVSASDVAEAQSLLSTLNRGVVITDVVMPEHSGLELVERVTGEYPDTAVVMMSGVDDPTIASDALELGAYGYLIKPFSQSELLIAVENAVLRAEGDREVRVRRAELEHTVAVRTDELSRLRKETIYRLARTAEARDHDTGSHIARVSDLCHAIALRLGLSPQHAERLHLASTLHDIGKIAVPDDILLKPGQLTEGERAIMQRHAEVGWTMLTGSGDEVLELAASIAYSHHERLDGTGYPRALIGDAIPLEGRIAAVADVYDALTSDRVYRRALSERAALAHLEDEAGVTFDADVVAALVATLAGKTVNNAGAKDALPVRITRRSPSAASFAGDPQLAG